MKNFKLTFVEFFNKWTSLKKKRLNFQGNQSFLILYFFTSNEFMEYKQKNKMTSSLLILIQVLIKQYWVYSLYKEALLMWYCIAFKSIWKNIFCVIIFIFNFRDKLKIDLFCLLLPLTSKVRVRSFFIHLLVHL